MSGCHPDPASKVVGAVQISALEAIKLESLAGGQWVRLAFVVGGVPVATKMLSAAQGRELAQQLDFHSTRALP